MRILSILLLLACACGYANAEPASKPEPNYQTFAELTYRVQDLVAKKEVQALWKFSLRADGEIKVQKEMPFSGIDETDIISGGLTTRFEKLGISQEEFLFNYDGRIQLGKEYIGHQETRDLATGELLFSYPLFFHIVGIGEALRGESRIFMNDGRMLTITRDFLSGQEFLPLMEQFTTKNILGEVTDDIVFTLQAKKKPRK